MKNELIPQKDKNLVLTCNSDNAYYVEPADEKIPWGLAFLKFQEGGIPTSGVNGITTEILLEIIAHRLGLLQSGPFPCKENAMALEYAQKALAFLYQRTENRRARGVEGKEVL